MWVRGMGMTAERQKIRAAEWLYRWNLSSSIIGIVFTILTFMGVFTIVLGPIFTEKFGFTYLQTALLLFLFVLGVIIGFGVYLDKVIHFWSAQATVATTRNPYLVSALYQKELLSLVYIQVPVLKSLRALLEAARPPGADSDRLPGPLRSRSAVVRHRPAHPLDGRPASSYRRVQAIPSCAWTGLMAPSLPSASATRRSPRRSAWGRG